MPWKWHLERADGTEADAEGEWGWQDLGIDHVEVCPGELFDYQAGEAVGTYPCPNPAHAEPPPLEVRRITRFTLDTDNGQPVIDLRFEQGDRLAFARRTLPEPDRPLWHIIGRRSADGLETYYHLSPQGIAIGLSGEEGQPRDVFHMAHRVQPGSPLDR